MIFVTGGEKSNFLYGITSKQAFKINVKIGEIKEMPDMSIGRQAHGMILACGKIYCCGGFCY